MLEVFIPSDAGFRKYEIPLRLLYEKVQDKIGDDNSFDFIRDHTLFYMFVFNNKLVGGIYYYIKDEKWYMNGFSNRKMFGANVECIKLSTTWFSSDIYAEAMNRASAICLLRAGFKRLHKNLFIFRQKITS